MNEELTVATAADMRALGRRLAVVLRAGDVVILSGPLGAGKTTLTQGIGEGLGIRGPVTSPTFVIARVHPPLAAAGQATGQAAGHAATHAVGGLTSPGPALVHADAYRIGSALELDDLDLDADTSTSVTVVEWGEGLAEGLAEDRLEVTITPGPALAGVPEGDEGGDSPRTVRVTGAGERWKDIQLPPAARVNRL